MMENSAMKDKALEREAKRRVEVWFCAADAVVGCTVGGFFFSYWVLFGESVDLWFAGGYFLAGVIGAVLCARLGSRKSES